MAEGKRKILYKPVKINFNALSGEEFENMCYWLIDDMKEFKDVHQIGVENTKAIDISAKKDKNLYYFQVKRYKDLNNQNIRKILTLLKEKIEDDGIIPKCFIIMTSSEIGGNKRIFLEKEAKRLGLKIPKMEIWDGNKIEKLLYKDKKVLGHFYKDETNVKIKRSSLSTLLMIISIFLVLFIGSIIVGLIFKDIPFISDFSNTIFGIVNEKSGYIQDFAEDLDELIIVRNINQEVGEEQISQAFIEILFKAQSQLLFNQEEECIKIINNLQKDKKYDNITSAHFLKGTAMFIRNYKKQEIEIVYNKSLNNNDVFWQLYNNLGVLLYHRAKINEALELFEKAVTIYDKAPEPYRNLAVTYNRLGYSNKALVTLLKAQDLINYADSSSGTLLSSKDSSPSKPPKFVLIDKTKLIDKINKSKEDIIKNKGIDIDKWNKDIKNVNIKDKKLINDINEILNKKNKVKLDKFND